MRCLKLVWLLLQVLWLQIRNRWVTAQYNRRMNRQRLRAMNHKRFWRGISPLGAVDLGKITEAEAIRRASQFGNVAHVDWQNAIIFYGTEQGGPPGDSALPGVQQ